MGDQGAAAHGWAARRALGRRRDWWRDLAAGALGAALAGGLVTALAVPAGASVVPSPSSCQASPAANGTDLAAAITAASGTTSSITLAPGCAYLVGAAGFTPYASGTNGPDAFAPVGPGTALTIVGNGATISAIGAATPMRFFEVDAGGSLTLDDLTLTGGHDTSGSGGGAIWSDGTLSVSDVTFSEDLAKFDGGAIANLDALQVSDSTFSFDTAGDQAGAIANGVGGGPATALVTGSSFTHDSADASGGFGGGGAIDNGDGGSGTLTVDEGTFSNDWVGSAVPPANQPPGMGPEVYGGAIASGVNGTGNLTVTRSTFTADAVLGTQPAEQPFGGAIAEGGGDGGGGRFAVRVSTFQGNTAFQGAAVFDGAGGSIVASTIAGNVATGAAVAGGVTPGSLLVAGTTLAADLIAGPAPGVAGGGPACSTQPVGGPAPVDGGYNLVFDASCALTSPTSKVVPDLSAELGTLADNRRATTDTMALSTSGSDPAVGAIPYATVNPTHAASYPQLCQRTDQTGYTSPAGSACAVGAYEPSPTSPTGPPSTGTSPPSPPSQPTLPPAFTGSIVSTPGVPVPLVTPPAPAPTLRVLAPSVSAPYGAPLPELPPSYEGFVEGDTVASLTTPARCTTTATAGSPVGTYPVVCAGAVAPHYTIVYVAGILQVTPARLVVQAPSWHERFGTTPPARLSPSYTGFVNGDGPASLVAPATCSTPTRRTSPVGTYPVRCRGAVDPNYVISYRPGTAWVQPVVLTVTGPSARVRYGTGPPGPLQPTYAGFVSNEGPSVLRRPASCTTSATAGSPVGAYATRCHGAASPNYRFRYVPGTLVVTPVPLVVHAPVRRGKAGDPLPAFPAAYVGFVHGDSPASLATPARCSTPATGRSPAGRYPVNCTGAADSNYAIRYVPGRLILTSPPPPPPPHAVIAGSAGLAAKGPGLPLPASVVDLGRVPDTGLVRTYRSGGGARGSATTVPAGSPVGRPTRLAIASIGADAPVFPVGDPGGVLLPPANIQTLGWWEAGVAPGAPRGTSVLVGHVDGRNAAGVPVVGALFYLDRTPLGATAVVRTTSGKVLNYVLVARRLYTKAALPTRAIFVRTGPPRLVVVTCGGPFDPATRHYQDNVVAYFVPAR